MKRPYQGLVLHIEAGTEEGTYGWFNTSKAERQAQFDKQGLKIKAYESSAHFGNPKRGPLDQFVNTDDQAFAQGPGNPTWLSCENEGQAGDTLTVNQIHNLARLMADLAENEGIQLSEANSPSDKGLGFHSMGASWGHPHCPGDVRQRKAILVMAQGIRDGKELPGSIPEWVLGWWSVYDANQYYYYFYEGGEVVYTEKQQAPNSLPQKIGNTGTVTMTEHGLDIRFV